jgi:hypothetical protein
MEETLAMKKIVRIILTIILIFILLVLLSIPFTHFAPWDVPDSVQFPDDFLTPTVSG